MIKLSIKSQKNYYIYNHLGSKAVEVDSVGNIIDYVQYSPFGEPLKKNNYQPQWIERLGYIDKEKDRESKLGDHGVRKYDYEVGRFTSVDPLWEKYTGWTGYQYSLNNPVNLVDFNGLNWFSTESGKIKWFDQQGDFSQISSGTTWTDLGSNVIVGRHNRAKNYSENVGSANFELYLESNTDGPTATESGNTVPTNINKRGVLSEGLYHGIVTSQKIGGNDRGKFVVLLEKGSKLKSLKPNPAHNNKLVMDEIFIHGDLNHHTLLQMDVKQ